MKKQFSNHELKAEIFANQQLTAFALALVHQMHGFPTESLGDLQEQLIREYRSRTESALGREPVNQEAAEFGVAYEDAIDVTVNLAKNYLTDLNRIRGSEQG